MFPPTCIHVMQDVHAVMEAQRIAISTLEGRENTLQKQLSQHEAAAVARHAADEKALQSVIAELTHCQDDLLVHKQKAEAATASVGLMAADKRALTLEQTAALQAELYDNQQRVVSLQSELEHVRAINRSAPAFGASVKAADVLSSMGLDSWRDDRLSDKGKKRRATLESDVRMEAGTLSKVRGEQNGAIKGRVMLRFWVIAAYLVILHFCLMLQFTHRQPLPCEPVLLGHSFGHMMVPEISKDHALP